MVDLALLFAELVRAPGVTQAELGRRYRKSAGYVSVMCRLGAALRPMSPEARDGLRVPHFTLKAAQALVSRHAEPEALRAAAARLAATPSAARVRARTGVTGQWDRAPAGPDRFDPLPDAPDAMARRDAFVYAWDEAAARRDPAAVLAEFEAFVRAATDEVVTRLRRAAGDYGPAARPAGERAAGPTRALDETALRRLDARVAETLRGHRARMDAFLAERDRARAPRAAGAGPGGTFPPAPVDPAEIEADLA